MVIVLAVAGFVMLIAIIWCIRTMRKGFTSLSADKERWRERFREEEMRLNKERSDIPALEQLNLLYAGVQDLLRLENIDPSLCVLEDGAVRVSTDKGKWLLTFHASEQKLSSVKKVLHGPGHWILRQEGLDGEKPQDTEYPGIAELMHAFHTRLTEDLPELVVFPATHRRHHGPNRFPQ